MLYYYVVDCLFHSNGESQSRSAVVDFQQTVGFAHSKTFSWVCLICFFKKEYCFLRIYIQFRHDVLLCTYFACNSGYLKYTVFDGFNVVMFNMSLLVNAAFTKVMSFLNNIVFLLEK